MRSFEIIIPAYNEEKNIAGLIRIIKETIGESGKITVIDDASEDHTAEIAKEGGAMLSDILTVSATAPASRPD